MSQSLTLPAFAPPRADETVRSGPPASGPVLIGDCASTADHATLLLALWRRWDTPPER